jgi:hypothetical protein
MTISWGPGWYANSTTGRETDPSLNAAEKEQREEFEKSRTEAMIMNSSEDTVREHAVSQEGGQVYVKNGLHPSYSEQTPHVTGLLGMDKPPWSSDERPAYTAHIKDEVDSQGRYKTDLFNGWPKDSNQKVKSSGGKSGSSSSQRPNSRQQPYQRAAAHHRQQPSGSSSGTKKWL